MLILQLFVQIQRLSHLKSPLAGTMVRVRGEYDTINERVQRITKPFIHVNIRNFSDLHPHEYVSDKCERLIKKGHKTRAGTEPKKMENSALCWPSLVFFFQLTRNTIQSQYIGEVTLNRQALGPMC